MVIVTALASFSMFSAKSCLIGLGEQAVDACAAGAVDDGDPLCCSGWRPRDLAIWEVVPAVAAAEPQECAAWRVAVCG